MVILPRPPYSPECNPAEQISKHTRTDDIRNQVFDDLDQIVGVVSSSLHTRYNDHDLIHSMTSFYLLATLRST